ncbi:MAG: DUF4278 domain-containing protein [Cyanobacteria bacterium P01_F01_bin.150]
MSLIYRGQTAQPSTIAETLETGLIGKFMGRSFPIRQAQQPVRATAKLLQFRGVIY